MPDAKSFASGEILSAADVNEYLAGGFWKRIDRVKIPSGSPVTSVSFTSIDSSFRVFRLMMATSTIVDLRLNNDSGTNYKNQLLQADGTTVTAQRSSGNTSIFTAFGNQPAVAEFIISKLASNVVAIAYGTASSYSSTNPFLQTNSASWNNTSALINRIDVYDSTAFYGVVALEGMASV